MMTLVGSVGKIVGSSVGSRYVFRHFVGCVLLCVGDSLLGPFLVVEPVQVVVDIVSNLKWNSEFRHSHGD